MLRGWKSSQGRFEILYLFFFFERYCSHYPLGCRWLIFFLFYVFFCGDLIVKCWHWHYVLRSFLPAIVSEDVRGVFFLVAGVTVLPRWLESSGVKRGGTLDITSCLQRTDSAGCREWIRVMLYKRDVRVFDNWSRNAISYALALTCNYFQISSGKELFWHLVIAGHPVVVENMW